MTNINYPSLDLIFDKLEEAITKLVIIQNKGSAGIGNQNYKQSTKSSNPSDLSKIQGSSDPKKAFLGNTGNSTSGNARKGKKFTKKGNNPNQTKKCIFCNADDHWFKWCQQLTNIDDRITIIKTTRGNNVCNKCLLEHSGSCNKNSLCDIQDCPDKTTHSKLVCTKTLQAIQSKLISVTTLLTFPITGVNNVATVAQRSVALETAVFTAHNANAKCMPLQDRNVSVLCDTAAQRSLITEAVAERLGFPIIRKEYACLQGYGQSKVVNQLFDVVVIKIGRPNEQHPIVCDALVVQWLNSLYMPGASAFSKKLVNKGVDLADFRLVNQKLDIITFNILAGEDYY
ncbi:unnamed protein product [Meganyctiphanes norvegica]|uniref:Peptidase aspartic putative domain-containing protein n=1 Tax=Meganyctiphanes norvegica TaxID=48144 RepID=A0AAV2SFU4_MEGNR